MNCLRTLHRIAEAASPRGGRWRPIVVLAVILWTHSVAAVDAHQGLFEQPSAAELAKTRPPLPGAEPLARALLKRFAGRFDAAELELLDLLQQRLQQADRVRWGVAENGSPELAEYFRWQAEQVLLQLLEDWPGVVEIDLRPGRQATEPTIPVSVQKQELAVVLKVIRSDRDDDQPTFDTRRWNLSSEQVPGPFRIETPQTGVHYVLLELEQTPSEQAVSQVQITGPEGAAPVVWRALQFESPRLGHLQLDIVDDNGRLTPALMQLVAADGRRVWEIPGAIDLREQLNDIVPHLSELGRGYTFYLPGKKRGRYWIVGGKIEATLPVGKWDVTLLRGPEHVPFEKRFEVLPGSWTRVSCPIERWENMPDRGWYSGDDHVHARLMSGQDADNLLAYVRAVDIHVANILEMGDPTRTYYAQRGFGPEFRVGDGSHWLVPGQEDPRSELGHAIGLNLRDKVRQLDRYLQNDWIAEQIHAQGGLYGHTHVGADACFVRREMALFTPLEIVDFNSIMQASLGTELYYDFLNLGFRMNASAGADTPYGGTIGATRVYAYVGDERPFTPDQWFAALQSGRTFVTNGPMLNFSVNGALPGETIEIEANQTLRVRVEARGLSGWSAPKALRLVRFGETLAETVATDVAQENLSLEIDLPTSDSSWLAAYAEGRDGSTAHTTPIYVVCEGRRHWHVDQVEALLDKQLAALDETQTAIEKSVSMVKKDSNRLDFWNRMNASQAAAVRSSVETARACYQQLREAHTREQNMRVAQDDKTNTATDSASDADEKTQPGNR